MKFQALVAQWEESIRCGEWAPGARLPAERVLAAENRVGINTVRRAIGVLVDRGAVDRRQGSGTFVIGHPPVRAGAQQLVGVLVPTTASRFLRLIAGAEHELAARGIRLLVASSNYRAGVERAQLRRLLGDGVQGLILTPSLHLVEEPQTYVDELRHLPVPYVLAERRPPAPAPDDETTFVTTDHDAGVYQALRHLVGLGHRRIGFLGRRRTATSDAVAHVFESACLELRLSADADVVQRRAAWSAEDIDAYLDAIIRSDVTAVFCHDDADAAALATRARRRGLVVPDDIALVAHDDRVASLDDTLLTAIVAPRRDVGATAARLLMRRMDDSASPSRRIELLPHLVIRSSTAAPTPDTRYREEREP